MWVPCFLCLGLTQLRACGSDSRWSQLTWQWPWCSQGYWCSLLPCLSSLVGAGGRVMCLNPSGCWPGLGPL